jgi:hypothetical protein
VDACRALPAASGLRGNASAAKKPPERLQSPVSLPIRQAHQEMPLDPPTMLTISIALAAAAALYLAIEWRSIREPSLLF